MERTDDKIKMGKKNPGNMKLTGWLFRGFWIGKRAHFHPVGQPPGRGAATGQRGEEAGREPSGDRNRK